MIVTKRLKQVLGGFVTMYKGMCKAGSPIPMSLAREIGRTLRAARVYRDNRIRQIGLNNGHNKIFFISSRES